MSDKKFKKVIIGGTFDILHKGHHSLIKKAFSLGIVTIGLTSDKMAKKTKRRKINSFNQRKEILKEFLKKTDLKDYKILEIEDAFGPTFKNNFDYIVVSPETYKTAILINKKRSQLSKKLIEIIEIDFVLAADGKLISATRILKNIIDPKGKLIKE